MRSKQCDNCGKQKTEGHLYHSPATNRTLCMCCKFIAAEAQRTTTEAPIIVYLACPYSHQDEDVRVKRFISVSQAAGWLVNNGYGVISPISQGHPIAEYGGAKGDWETWAAVDKRMIEASDAVIVLNLRGLFRSVGVRAEVQYAFSLGKPLSVMTPMGNTYSFIQNDDAALFLATDLGIVPLPQSEKTHG